MIRDSQKLQHAIEQFDAANAEDPHGKELAYARQMTQWLDRLAPDASEPLRLAARAQHICRWQIPRSDFPMDRTGYHRWRTTLYTFHADKAAQIMRQAGYEDAIIARVRSLLRKEKIKLDPEMQTLEDVVCLVFLENYFGDFARDKDEQKLIGIIRRTWAKMSPRGHEAAMNIKMSEADQL